VKQDIQSLCKSGEVLQRDLDMQRRPVCSLSSKTALARRPLTPSAAVEPAAAFRSDSIEAMLGKILSQADAADGECKLCDDDDDGGGGGGGGGDDDDDDDAYDDDYSSRVVKWCAQA
jgi:hypothetical protein